MRRLSCAALIVTAVFIASAATQVQAELCRLHDTCESCLNDPNCGWCASANDCAPGTAQGPSEGNCTLWDFTSCPSNGPATQSPHPSTKHWWDSQGGDKYRTRYVADTVGSINATVQWQDTAVSVTVPALYHGLIYYVAVVTVTGNASLRVLNATSGESVHSVSLGQPSKAGPPTISPEHNMLFVQLIGSNEGTYLRAYRLTKHSAPEHVWTATASAQWSTYNQGVLIVDDLVYMPGGEYSGMLYAFNISNYGERVFGVQLYSTEAGDDRWAPTLSRDDTILWSTEAGEESPCATGAVDPKNGSSVWSAEFQCSWGGYSTYWSPMVAPNGVIIASLWSPTYGIFPTALVTDVTTVETLWTADNCTNSASLRNPATDGTNVYYVCGLSVRAISLENGTTTTEYPCADCVGTPIVTEDYVLALTTQGLKVFKKKDYDGKPHHVLQSDGYSHDMAYQDGWVYVSTDKQVMAVQLNTPAP